MAIEEDPPADVGIRSIDSAVLAGEKISKPLVNVVVDWILRLQRQDRRAWLADVALGIDLFPALGSIDKQAVLKRIAIRDAYLRIYLRVILKWPAVAQVLARLMPVRDRKNFDSIPADRPIVLGPMHFGPIHLACVVLARLLPTRTVHVVHADGDQGREVARFFSRIGIHPILNDSNAMPKIRQALTSDPRCAVIIAFDYMGRPGRRVFPLLGASVRLPNGTASIADEMNAVVVPAYWESCASGLRLVICEAEAVDYRLDQTERQTQLLQRLLQLLGARVSAEPQDWTEWHNCPKSVVRSSEAQ
jgi:lauroyl/myristoyl acyltransferase